MKFSFDFKALYRIYANVCRSQAWLEFYGQEKLYNPIIIGGCHAVLNGFLKLANENSFDTIQHDIDEKQWNGRNNKKNCIHSSTLIHTLIIKQVHKEYFREHSFRSELSNRSSCKLSYTFEILIYLIKKQDI